MKTTNWFGKKSACFRVLGVKKVCVFQDVQHFRSEVQPPNRVLSCLVKVVTNDLYLEDPLPLDRVVAILGVFDHFGALRDLCECTILWLKMPIRPTRNRGKNSVFTQACEGTEVVKENPKYSYNAIEGHCGFSN